jgi:hypothetical protein
MGYMATNSDTPTRPPAAAAARTRRWAGRWPGVLMLASALTFGVASYLHLDGRIMLGFTTVTGEDFTGAAVPEAVIGGLLAVGAAFVLARRAAARGVALGTTVFAIAGTVYGMTIILRGTVSRPADVVYHSAILAVLLVTLFGLLLTGRRAGAGGGRGVSGRVPGS